MSKARTVLVALAFVLMATAFSPGEALANHAAFPGDILYSSGGNIYRTHADGTGAAFVVGHSYGQAVWSRDHTRVAYIHTNGAKHTIWTVYADGTHARQLKYSKPWKGWKAGNAEGSLAWSPDGRYLCYADTVRGTLDKDYLVVVNLKKLTSRRLAKAANMGGHFWGVDFTASSKYVLEWEDVAAAGMLRPIRVKDGKRLSWVDTSDSIISVDVSPNGKRLLVCARDIDSGDHYLRVMDVNGANVTNLLWFSADSYVAATDACWSPDGTQVVCNEVDEVAETTATKVITAGGSDVRTLSIGLVEGWH